MSILKIDEIRKMSAEERASQLEELQRELMEARGRSSAGGSIENPGRIRELRRTIAKIKTVAKEYGDGSL
ncbi:MAG: 50S ribosomal protein L29 [Candidatus Syntropharchaeia archaeon]